MHQSFISFLKKRIHSIGLGLIVVFYLLNGSYYIRNQSLTSDEADFLNYAFRYVKEQPDRTNPRVDNSKLPVSVLNLTPRMATQLLNPSLKKEDDGFSDIMNGRYVTLFVSVFTILLVFVWGKELYGKNAGLLSAFLMSLCPNNISLAGLVTTDAYSVLFLMLNMYLLWKFLTTKQNKFFLLFSVVLAISQMVKQSLFHLYVLVPVIMIIYAVLLKESFKWSLFFKRLLFFAIIQLIIINTGYYFHGSFMQLGDYHFLSNLFQSVQQAMPGSLLLPIPRPFVEGLDMVKYYDQIGGGIDKVSSFGKVTVLGNSKTGGGFWYYYFVTLFYKMPIPYFAFFIWSIVLLFKRILLRNFIQKEFFLMAPVVYFLLLLSFFYQTQCGVRHIVFIYPFLFILSGYVMQFMQRKMSRLICAVLCIYLVISVGRYAGNYYPYTNEFILNKKKAYSKVGSANLEIRQGYYFAEKYLASHKEVSWAPVVPQTGRFIISVRDYLDIWNRHQYDWIQQFEPTGHVAYNFLLIDVDKVNLKRSENKPEPQSD